MKKSILSILFFIVGLTSCNGQQVVGGSVTFKADLISNKAVKEEKSFKHKGYTFKYYNVYNDGNGNFIMKDNTSYIFNDDIQFGLRVKSSFVYSVNNDKEELIEYRSYNQESGYYDYAIISLGFKIKGTSNEDSSIKDINIGTITHWC